LIDEINRKKEVEQRAKNAKIVEDILENDKKKLLEKNEKIEKNIIEKNEKNKILNINNQAKIQHYSQNNGKNDYDNNGNYDRGSGFSDRGQGIHVYFYS
jgi:phage protein D